MKYQISVAGIGLCIDGITDYEELIEAVISDKKPEKQNFEPSARYAVNEAMKYYNGKSLTVISNFEAVGEIFGDYIVSEYKIADSFMRMLAETVKMLTEKQTENVMLLSGNVNGYAAVLMSGKDERCMVAADIEIGDLSLNETEAHPTDAMLQFITAVIEVRYAFKLDGSAKDNSYIWDWSEKRELTRNIDGATVHITEPELMSRQEYKSKRYLIPITFDSTEEAEEKLRLLLCDAAENGLYHTMISRTAELKNGRRGENTVVLLAENIESLKKQAEELISVSNKLLTEGFNWKSDTGSVYVRKTAKNPKVVFMNPPGGMLSGTAFLRYVGKLHEFVNSDVRFEKNAISDISQNEIMRRYLEEGNITYVVMMLLEAIGIKPDYLSGASMGEIAFDLFNKAVRVGDSSAYDEAIKAIAPIEAIICNIIENSKKYEKAYFGREIDPVKFYLKCDSDQAKKIIAKYEDVFVIIEGSPKDLLICGDRTSCFEVIKELGCIPIELEDTMYVHTPIVECEYEKIRRIIMDTGLRLDTDSLPYKLFSTYMKREMDSTCEMLAENIAAIVARPVNYTEAIKTLYENEARVFIDLSTSQLCGTWAKNTLTEHNDIEVVSIYEDKDLSDYLLDLCAVMMAGNTAFDFEKILSGLTFENDEVKANAADEAEEKVMTDKKTTAEKIREAPKEADIKDQLNQYLLNQMAVNRKAYEMYLDAENQLFGQLMSAYTDNSVQSQAAPKRDYLWDREQVIEMTDNSMSAILGKQYEEVDKYPVRARMPLPPFLFVSRIISIDAEFGKLRPSSIVAEYDLDEECVFRTGDTRISSLIGSEASHIAIFLIAYMGLDAMSKGTLSYRAVDSSQISYSEKPFRVGDTMRTVLKINRFIQNGSTILMFFSFETYNGDELVAVTEATGGFFTKEELASNKGIITPKRVLNKPEPKEFLHFSDLKQTSYNEEQVSEFYNGNYNGCFGEVRVASSMKEKYYVKYMKMIDRVTDIDYNGGMYGRGFISGEKQLTPDMWPFKAHFKNDPVFPAIVMTDGVTQLCAFLFAHSGLLSIYKSTDFTMITGNCVKSKFRGQARHGYSTLRYDVHVKDVIRTDDSVTVYFDAGIFNDGIQIISVENFALKVFNAEK